MTAEIKPIRYHGPGWELDFTEGDLDSNEVRYIVWAPGEVVHAGGHKSGNVRTEWAANWMSHRGEKGNHQRGETLADVLGIFPREIAADFRQVIEG